MRECRCQLGQERARSEKAENGIAEALQSVGRVGREGGRCHSLLTIFVSKTISHVVKLNVVLTFLDDDDD